MCWQELKHDLKAVKAGLSLLQMKYQQEFTSLGDIISYNKFEMFNCDCNHWFIAFLVIHCTFTIAIKEINLMIIPHGFRQAFAWTYLCSYRIPKGS
jgi:hypothetical protein